MKRAFTGALFVAVLALPAMRTALEGVMVVHMLIQVPLLAVAAPVRVCNYYLVEQQVVAGAGLLCVSVGLAVVAGILAFRPVEMGSDSIKGQRDPIESGRI